nr:hypothetical protein [Candidatus Sigynarchaeota archaeon]
MTSLATNMEDSRLEALETRKSLWTGTVATAILYVAMGFFAIVASKLIPLLPLNTPGIYDVVGRMQHVYGLRYGTSAAFFGLGTATLVIGYFYKKQQEDLRIKTAARIMAIVQQSWLPLAILVIAAIWLLQGLDPSGDVAQVFAPLYGIDVTTQIGRLHYLYIIGGMPTLEFLFFAIGCFAIQPFTFYTSAVVLHDTGLSMPGKSMNYEQRTRMYACKGTFQAGILYVVMGVVVFAIGFVLGIGIDITWPLFKQSHYALFMNVYLWFPIGFGVACIVTSALYYA